MISGVVDLANTANRIVQILRHPILWNLSYKCRVASQEDTKVLETQ